MKPDRLLSLRLILRPAADPEIRQTRAELAADDEIPDNHDSGPGWLLERKDDGHVIGIVAGLGEGLFCAIDPGPRRRGYGSEALVRLALDYAGDFPEHVPRPRSTAARALLEKLGYRSDSGPAMALGCSLNKRANMLRRPWTEAYRRRVRGYHRTLGVPRDYARRHGLALVMEADRLHPIGRDPFDRDQYLAPAAAAGWGRMREAASADAITLNSVSAYRGIDYQAALLERKLAGGALIGDILKVSAAPGFSEHHSGLALDVGTPGSPPLEEAFEDTPAYRWLCRRAGEFAFHLSYPRGNPHGIAFEPWHWAHRD